MLFMSISFASGTQRKPVFWWNMGLNQTFETHFPGEGSEDHHVKKLMMIDRLLSEISVFKN